jgi:hypothetical protein
MRAIVSMTLLGLALAATAAGDAQAAQDAVLPKERRVFRYDSKGRRDPFTALVRDGRLVATGPGMRVEESRPVLYGVLWDPGGRSIALINDLEVRKGDRIGPYEVMEIRRDAVVLDLAGQPVVLTIAFDAMAPRLPSNTTKGGEGR